eukprot:199673-Pyramimonas_sp.AAC.1
MANAITRRAWQCSHIGLIFLKTEPPYRMFAVADASHASSKTSYAVEGQMAIKMTDRVYGLSSSGKIKPDRRNGYGHCLVHSAKRAKRISHSTSHASLSASAAVLPTAS